MPYDEMEAMKVKDALDESGVHVPQKRKTRRMHAFPFQKYIYKYVPTTI